MINGDFQNYLLKWLDDSIENFNTSKSEYWRGHAEAFNKICRTMEIINAAKFTAIDNHLNQINTTPIKKK